MAQQKAPGGVSIRRGLPCSDVQETLRSPPLQRRAHARIGNPQPLLPGCNSRQIKMGRKVARPWRSRCIAASAVPGAYRGLANRAFGSGSGGRCPSASRASRAARCLAIFSATGSSGACTTGVGLKSSSAFRLASIFGMARRIRDSPLHCQQIACAVCRSSHFCFGTRISRNSFGPLSSRCFRLSRSSAVAA